MQLNELYFTSAYVEEKKLRTMDEETTKADLIGLTSANNGDAPLPWQPIEGRTEYVIVKFEQYATASQLQQILDDYVEKGWYIFQAQPTFFVFEKWVAKNSGNLPTS